MAWVQRGTKTLEVQLPTPPQGDDWQPKWKRSQRDADTVCEVHVEGLKYEDIKPFSQALKLDCQDRTSRRQLKQPTDSQYRVESACDLLPEILNDYHGYHQIWKIHLLILE
ncbi:hypothetical protein Pcinc_004655 [Petrolisthes cinctipes]|uniref:Uncharacterized protein n=1 Tax=Petrolisthes cinctipes TaxID=88211 RepID=A0AAE1GGN3_PETCI|nr:hypothetical protein Pcinc_004655 [Petrolisthes cinctipes]